MTNYNKGIENKAYVIFFIIVHFKFVGINLPNNMFFSA